MLRRRTLLPMVTCARVMHSNTAWGQLGCGHLIGLGCRGEFEQEVFCEFIQSHGERRGRGNGQSAHETRRELGLGRGQALVIPEPPFPLSSVIVAAPPPCPPSISVAAAELFPPPPPATPPSYRLQQSSFCLQVLLLLFLNPDVTGPNSCPPKHVQQRAHSKCSTVPAPRVR